MSFFLSLPSHSLPTSGHFSALYLLGVPMGARSQTGLSLLSTYTLYCSFQSTSTCLTLISSRPTPPPPPPLLRETRRGRLDTSTNTRPSFTSLDPNLLLNHSRIHTRLSTYPQVHLSPLNSFLLQSLSNLGFRTLRTNYLLKGCSLPSSSRSTVNLVSSLSSQSNINSRADSNLISS